MKILQITNNINYFKDFFEKAKINYSIVENYIDAVNLIKCHSLNESKKFDILIIDNFNRNETIDTILQIRSNQLDILILVLLEKVTNQDMIYFMQAGADDYLPKHCNKLLLCKLHSLIRIVSKEYLCYIQLNSRAVLSIQYRTVLINKKIIKLHPNEYALLETLVSYKNSFLSQKKIIEIIYLKTQQKINNIQLKYILEVLDKKKILPKIEFLPRRKGYLV